MLTEIKLYGHLREHTGRSSFKAKVNNPADAVKFLLANFPSLEGEMIEQYYQVAVKGESVNKDQLHDPVGSGTIEFIPVLVGQGGGGFRNIIIGAILIAVAWYALPAASGIGTASAAAAGGGGISAGFKAMTLVAKHLTYMGAFLVFNGIAELFAPKEEPDAKDPESANFSGAVNTTLATTPIPIVYGEVITGSIVISAGIDTADLNMASASNLVNSAGNSVAVETKEDGTYISKYNRVGETEQGDDLANHNRFLIRIYREEDEDGDVKIELQNGDIQDDDGYKYAGSYTDEELKKALDSDFAQNNLALGIQISSNDRSDVYYPGTLVERIPDNENSYPTYGTTSDGDDGTWENGFYYSVITGKHS